MTERNKPAVGADCRCRGIAVRGVWVYGICFDRDDVVAVESRFEI